MSERLSIYLDANTMLKLHDIHKVIGANVPGGVSTSKAVAYAIITCWGLEFAEKLTHFTDEERAVVAKYAPQPPSNEDGGEER